ncbi:MAG: hypothetical protein ABW039_13935, partial [Sphingobium sp.]
MVLALAGDSTMTSCINIPVAETLSRIRANLLLGRRQRQAVCMVDVNRQPLLSKGNARAAVDQQKSI